MYTDGSHKDGKAGYGIFFGKGDCRNVSRRVDSGEQTITRAEMMAIRETLVMYPRDAPLTILSDSETCLKNIKKWTSPYTKGSIHKVPHKDLIKEITNILAERSRITKTSLIKVRAHKGV